MYVVQGITWTREPKPEVERREGGRIGRLRWFGAGVGLRGWRAGGGDGTGRANGEGGGEEGRRGGRTALFAGGWGC